MKKKNMKKIKQFLGQNISQTTKLIFFLVRMQGCVYGGHKIHKVGTNQPRSYRDTRGLKWQLSSSCK